MKNNTSPNLTKHNLELTEHELAVIESIFRRGNIEFTKIYDILKKKNLKETSPEFTSRFYMIRNVHFTIESLYKKVHKVLATKGSFSYRMPRFNKNDLNS